MNCQSCGANDYKDSKCTYCGSLCASMRFIFNNPGVGIRGTWVDGVCIKGQTWKVQGIKEFLYTPEKQDTPIRPVN